MASALLGISLALQLAAAVLVLRLIRVSRRPGIWGPVAAALLLTAAWRGATAAMGLPASGPAQDLLTEAVVLAVSALGVVGRPLREQELGVAVDDGEEVVEVVGDPAREPADRLHLLGLEELLLQADPLRQVVDVEAEAADGALAVPEGDRQGVGPEARAVPADQPPLLRDPPRVRHRPARATPRRARRIGSAGRGR